MAAETGFEMGAIRHKRIVHSAAKSAMNSCPVSAAQPILQSAGGDVTDQICEIHNNLTYATHDGVELKGDLYLPAGSGPFPVIVNVHGGYWRRGSRDTVQYLGPFFAARRYPRLYINF